MNNNEVISILSRSITKFDPNLVNTEFFESDNGDLVIFVNNEKSDYIISYNMLARFHTLVEFLFSNNVGYSINMCFIGDELDPFDDSVPKIEYMQIIVFKKEYEKLNHIFR